MAGTSRCRCAPRKRVCASAKSRFPIIAAPAAARRWRAACVERCAPERASSQPFAAWLHGLLRGWMRTPMPDALHLANLRALRPCAAVLALTLMTAPAPAQTMAPLPNPVRVADLIDLPIVDGNRVPLE